MLSNEDQKIKIRLNGGYLSNAIEPRSKDQNKIERRTPRQNVIERISKNQSKIERRTNIQNAIELRSKVQNKVEWRTTGQNVITEYYRTKFQIS